MCKGMSLSWPPTSPSNRLVPFWKEEVLPQNRVVLPYCQLCQLVSSILFPCAAADLQSATLPGIRDPKNFAALLEAIGYGEYCLTYNQTLPATCNAVYKSTGEPAKQQPNAQAGVAPASMRTAY